MNRYELVVLIDSKLKKDDIQSSLKTVEDLFGEDIKQKDDIWILELTWQFEWHDRAYFVSYEMITEWAKVEAVKKDLFLMKPVIRYFFYKMWKNEKFLKFADVSKMFELTDEEKSKQKNIKAFQDMDSVSKIKW